MTYIDRSPN